MDGTARAAEILISDRGPGGNGRDTISVGRGDDYVDVQGDGRIDEVSCGSGRDVLRANPEDNLDESCEVAKGVAGPK